MKKTFVTRNTMFLLGWYSDTPHRKHSGQRKKNNRSSEIAHLTEEQNDHSTRSPRRSPSVFYSLGEQHAMGIHMACKPAFLVSLICTGFALVIFPVLHTYLFDIRS